MELDIIRFIQQFSSDGMDAILILVTMFGEENILIGILTFMYWGIDKRFGKILGFAMMMTLVINNGLKELFNFDRPIGQEGIRSLRVETATGKAFPSGHTQNSSTFYTMVAMYFDKKWVKSLCGAIIFAVGISRLYLGVHYPKDVLAAWVLGILIAIAVYYGLNNAKKPLYIFFAGAGLGLVLLPIAQSEDFYKSLGLAIGFAAGCYIESRFVNYSTDVRWLVKVTRFVIGIILILAIKTGLKVVLPHSMVSDMLRYLMVSLTGFGLYPWLFNRKFVKGK